MSIMNASVSGMLADTNWLSTISQNVANANTIGYKNVETEFATLVEQAAANGSEALTGVTSSVRSLNALQGAVAATSTTTDLAVQGNGYFVVSSSSGALYLTRNGSFVPDSSGNLVNAAGYYLMGYPASQTSTPANSLSGLQKVNANSAAQDATPTTSGVLSANLPSTATVVPAANLPSTNLTAATYTDETSLVTYDNLGASHTINVYFAKTGTNTWEVDAYDASTASANGGFPYSSGPLATQSLNFNATTGALTSGSPITLAIPNGQSMTLDLSNTTQLASSFNIASASANGNAPSTLNGVGISTNGVLSYQFKSGITQPGYDIPLANVASPDNMTNVNGDAFLANASSGGIYVGTAGSAGFGTIASSSLEDSTVDLATELTDMIQAQSAYEANSKVFQTGANILDVLNGLKP